MVGGHVAENAVLYLPGQWIKLTTDQKYSIRSVFHRNSLPLPLLVLCNYWCCQDTVSHCSHSAGIRPASSGWKNLHVAMKEKTQALQWKSSGLNLRNHLAAWPSKGGIQSCWQKLQQQKRIFRPVFSFFYPVFHFFTLYFFLLFTLYFFFPTEYFLPIDPSPSQCPAPIWKERGSTSRRSKNFLAFP